MKKLCVAVLAAVLVSGVCWAGDAKIIFRDYNPLDLFSSQTTKDPGVGAFSMGVCSWTDDVNTFEGGVYWDFKYVMLFDEKLNLGAGMIFKPPRGTGLMDLVLETSVTSHWLDCLEVGAYYCPFWGLTRYSDPYGAMVGYYWKF
jgi:hypothetical protein